MITITFKNVDQGDSIVITWDKDGEPYFGIIDCNITRTGNPVLNYLKQNSITKIEFILLTHFHYDHFSGMADIFEYCINNTIRPKFFFHTIAGLTFEIYNRIFTSQKIQQAVVRFIEKYEVFSDYVVEDVPVHCFLQKFSLNEEITLSFLAPKGNIYKEMTKKLARKVNKLATTSGDINKFSTIVCIKKNDECYLLTSDAVKGSFRSIFSKINEEKKVLLVQVPHHGSIANIAPEFWQSINKIKNCPSVFSVGDEPKDKLPDVQTVEFFNNNGFEVYATNSVYGINEYFKVQPTSTLNSKIACLNIFSVSRNVISNCVNNKYSGDQVFTF